MTIDNKAFSQHFSVLLESKRVELSDPAIAMWKRFLDPQISTEEFVKACRISFIRDQYLPTPEQFVAHVKGDNLVNSLVDWEIILENYQVPKFSDLVNRLTFAGLRAIDILHMPSRDCSEVDLSFKRKEFISLWPKCKFMDFPKAGLSQHFASGLLAELASTLNLTGELHRGFSSRVGKQFASELTGLEKNLYLNYIASEKQIEDPKLRDCLQVLQFYRSDGSGLTYFAPK